VDDHAYGFGESAFLPLLFGCGHAHWPLGFLKVAPPPRASL
jgi:hypothetical protein